MIRHSIAVERDEGILQFQHLTEGSPRVEGILGCLHLNPRGSKGFQAIGSDSRGPHIQRVVFPRSRIDNDGNLQTSGQLNRVLNDAGGTNPLRIIGDQNDIVQRDQSGQTFLSLAVNSTLRGVRTSRSTRSI